MPLAGNSLRAEKSHWQVQKVTLAGRKSHTRAKMSHWSVIIMHIVLYCCILLGIKLLLLLLAHKASHHGETRLVACFLVKSLQLI